MEATPPTRRPLLLCLPALLGAALAAQEPKLPEFPKAVAGFKRAPADPDAKGLFDVYVKDNKVLASLPRGILDQKLLVIGTLASGLGRGWLLAGMPIDDSVLRFSRSGNKVWLFQENPHFTAKPGSPTARALASNYPESILAVLPVVANAPGGGALVDLSSWLFSDPYRIAREVGRELKGAYRFDASRTRVAYAKAFPHNVEIRVNAAYTGQPAAKVDIAADARFTTLAVHLSFHNLPKTGYTPRIADDRVGYFVTARRDFTKLTELTTWVRYINRWQIEKADPGATRSPPKKPLVYWIENTVPYRWRKWIREGVLAWNRAFDEAGIVNAIEVRQQPDDADWDPEDARYNSLRWIASHKTSFGAIGPSRVNPFTGQILDADILFEASMLRGYWQEYQFNVPAYPGPSANEAGVLGAAGFNDLRLRGYCSIGEGRARDITLMSLLTGIVAERGVPEDFVGRALRETVMHEVGHTLGLRHNFKASKLLGGKALHDAAKTRTEGLIGSVMDYNSINIAAPGEKQGEYYASCVGPYDRWAIRYGYTPVKTPAEISKIASECAKPGHAYATDEDARGAGSVDPDATTFDMGSDSFAFARTRIALTRDLLGKVSDRLVAPGEGHQFERFGVNSLLAQVGSALGFVAKKIGGVRVHRDHKGDPGARVPMEPVPAQEQREALAFVVEHGFTDSAFRVSPEQLARLTPMRWAHWGVRQFLDRRVDYTLIDRVAALQKGLLVRVFDPAVLSRVEEAELRVKPGAKPFTLPELYKTVRKGVFAELASGKPVSVFRRNVQRAFVDILVAQATRKVAGLSDDARAAAYSGLTKLEGMIGGAKQDGLDDYTRQHYLDLSVRVRKALGAVQVQQG